ncbi:sensor histidine kinase [Zhihengliuella alba]|uniref:histidine kinase n=1 Tax=Zhihengliuella alba TaxID=547018 RepID=A0ABP7CJF0_9MICC
MSLARRLFLWQLAVVVLLSALLAAVSYDNTRDRMREETAARVQSVSATLANDPFVAAHLAGPDPTAQLQPYTGKLLEEADVDFVTIMTPDGTRVTHPDPAEIGRPYLGTIEQARAGRPHVEEYVGTLGPSVRAISPVFVTAAPGGGDGAAPGTTEPGTTEPGTVDPALGHSELVGLVAVGVTSRSLDVALASDIPAIGLVAGLALGLGGIGSYAIAGYVRRATLDLGPEQLRRLFDYYDSALHSLREGLLLTDATGRLVLYNDRAAQLLGLSPVDPRHPRAVEDAGLPEPVAHLIADGRTAEDEVHLAHGRILILNQHSGERGGVVTTVQDHTDLQSLAGELESMRTLADALRAQTHEHANRLHTVASLIELGRTDEALRFAVEDRQASQQLTDDVVRSLDEPYLSALLVGKAAQAHERGIELTLTASGELPPDSLDARDLVTITGNLLDNAFDAAAEGAQRRVWADFAATGEELLITVADSGPGIDDELIEEFLRFGASSKIPAAAGPPESGIPPGSGAPSGTGAPSSSGAPRGVGLALVRQAVLRLGGTLEIENDGGAIFTATLPLRGDAA